MFIAALRDTPYNIVLLLHIVTAMVAFAPAFTRLINQYSESLDSGNQRTVVGFLGANGRKIYAPALIVSGLLGFALSGMSSSVYKMSQGWMIASALLWIAMNGVLHAMILPNEMATADGDASAEAKVNTGGMIITAMLVVMLYLMIWKPGL